MKKSLMIPLLCLLGACASTPQDLLAPGSRPVTYKLVLNIKDGQLDAFRAVMTEMVTSTKQEPGTLVYEWYLTTDGKTCHINERFHDSAAHAAHGEGFKKFAERFLACVEVVSMTVYGNPEEAARARLARLEPTYIPGIGGFRR
jgi:quinol monooxygenase YgiN